MKQAHWILLGAVVGGVCLWAGRTAWRARQDLVTLHVRNAPLAAVVSSLERQTWESIVADGRLDERITLDVEDAPLGAVLDRLGMQAGALASTLHAVHRSSEALSKLRQSLRQGMLATDPDWVQWAPMVPVPGKFPMEFPDGPPGPPPDFDPPPSDGLAGPRMRRRFLTEDHIAGQGGPGRGAGPGDVIRTVRMGDDGNVQEEVITPEKIVVESGLTNRLRTTPRGSPDLETARSVARTAGARCTTLYTLQQSALASLGFRGGGLTRDIQTTPAGSEAGRVLEGGPPPLEQVEGRAQHQALGRYRDLTPEQRARQIRERQPRIFP